METSNIGLGAGSGLFSAVLTYLGFKHRLDRLERDLDKHKDQVVYKDTCQVCANNINKKLDYIIERVDNL